MDTAGRAALTAGGTAHRASVGVVVYDERAASDTFFVVVSGAVALSTVRRGDERASEIRRAGPGDTFGEEPLLHAGAVRRATATAVADTLVLELPATLYTRVAGKVGGNAAQPEIRRLRRNATADLLRTMAATRELAERELQLMLDAIETVVVPRGERIYGPGDRSDAYYLVDTGLVQLQTEDPETGDIGVCGYVARGDGFGHHDALAGQPRTLGAVSMGHTRLAKIDAAALRTVVDRNPELGQRLSRVVQDRQQRQATVAAQTDARSTRHVFADLYRMQVARSMLVIDTESCVRCGHCAWTCADLHGVARLVRRGDKILTRVSEVAQAPAKSLMVVNSCQHCKNPVCMLDCPTGAIGRQAEGEVFITDALCTGCGACAKACPWENIRMATRPGVKEGSGATGPGSSEQLATKCDLCRDYDEPGCVQACPTDAITRLDPTRDVAEVADVLGVTGSPGAGGVAAGRRMSAVVRAVTIVLGVSLSAWALSQRRAGVWIPHSGVGWALGWLGLMGMLGSAGYGFIKRVPKAWMARRRRGHAAATTPRPPPRSKVRGWLDLHMVLGTLTIVAVFGHAGVSVTPGPYGSLLLASWAVFGLGIGGAMTYRWLPPWLSRLERRGTLPEDLAGEHDRLLDALYRQMSGSSARVKTIAKSILVPYARAPLGPLWLALSGRGQQEARAALARRIEARFAPQTDQDVADAPTVDGLVRIVVELRTVPVRRTLSFALRGWMPVHAALTGVVLALLAIHIAIALGRPG